MIFRLVPFRSVAEFIKANQLQHFTDASEIAGHHLPNIDIEYYLEASDAGMCVVIVGEDAEGIGAYSVFMIGNAPNHKHIIEATNTGIWVRKDKRGRASIDLIKQAECLLPESVDEITYCIPEGRLGAVFAMQRYRPQYTVWTKRNVKKR